MNRIERNKIITEMYLSGESSRVIAEKFGLTDRGVRHILETLGVERRKTGYKKYRMNEDFFKVWSNEMAWVLGMVITDGTIMKNAFLVGQKELYPLLKIKELIGFNGEIPDIRGAGDRRGQTDRDHHKSRSAF